MALPVYTYEIADLLTGQIREELPLQRVSFSKTLNGPGQLQADLPIWDLARRGLNVNDLSTPCRHALYVYRDSRPVWGGVLWTRQYDSTTQTINLGAGDWWTYFDHRYLIPAIEAGPPVPTNYIAPRAISWVSVEQCQIAREMVDWSTVHTAGDIGIEFDLTADSNTDRDRTYYGYDLLTIGEALRQLANVESGPDMRFDVLPGSNGRPRRVFLTGTPHLGQQGSPHVLELGGNVASYSWSTDGSRMATRAFALGDGIEADTPIAVAEDTASYLAGWPLLEVEAGYSTVRTDSVLQSHADADQFAARLPVAHARLELAPNSSVSIVDISPGDDARVVLDDPFWAHLDGGLNTYMRLVSLDVTPVDSGGERVSLTMAPLLDSPV